MGENVSKFRQPQGPPRFDDEPPPLEPQEIEMDDLTGRIVNYGINYETPILNENTFGDDDPWDGASLETRPPTPDHCGYDWDGDPDTVWMHYLGQWKGDPPEVVNERIRMKLLSYGITPVDWDAHELNVWWPPDVPSSWYFDLPAEVGVGIYKFEILRETLRPQLEPHVPLVDRDYLYWVDEKRKKYVKDFAILERKLVYLGRTYFEYLKEEIYAFIVETKRIMMLAGIYGPYFERPEEYVEERDLNRVYATSLKEWPVVREPKYWYLEIEEALQWDCQKFEVLKEKVMKCEGPFERGVIFDCRLQREALIREFVDLAKSVEHHVFDKTKMRNRMYEWFRGIEEVLFGEDELTASSVILKHFLEFEDDNEDSYILYNVHYHCRKGTRKIHRGIEDDEEWYETLWWQFELQPTWRLDQLPQLPQILLPEEKRR